MTSQRPNKDAAGQPDAAPAAPRRIALLTAYDGTGYAGFQWQANAPTIQGELESAIARLTGERVRIRGASRTDAGAHAEGQVVDFVTGSRHPERVFVSALNHYLPDAVRVLDSVAVPDGFHARRSAARRCYRYRILNRPTPAPLLRRNHHWEPAPLDIAAMGQAAVALVGIRDFRQLATGHPPDRSAVRQVFDWRITRHPAAKDVIIVDCCANGFLRHQIRRANAVLAAIGKGDLPAHAMAEALAGRLSQRRQIAPLPAKGLCLMSVSYPGYDHLLQFKGCEGL